MSRRPTYAAGTGVPADKTRLEIEQLVRRRGADAFGYAEEGHHARVSFKLDGRLLRFDVPLPHPQEFETVLCGAAGLQPRKPQAIIAALDRATREKWRALLLCIKAKLAAVDAGVVTFEEEFLAHVVMSDGRTVGEVATRQLAIAREGGEQPKLLSDYTGGRS